MLQGAFKMRQACCPADSDKSERCKLSLKNSVLSFFSYFLFRSLLLLFTCHHLPLPPMNESFLSSRNNLDIEQGKLKKKKLWIVDD